MKTRGLGLALALAVAPLSRGAETRRAPSAVGLPAVFSNVMTARRDLVSGLGFDPVKLHGVRLNAPDEPQVLVQRVLAPAGAAPVASLVVKTAPYEAITRELFARRVIDSFPFFSERFEASRSAGVPLGWFDGRAALVSEDLEASRAGELPLAERGPLAALTYGLGISDLNEEGILRVPGRRTVLNDLEGALTPLREDMVPGSLNDPMLHLSYHHLNDLRDYLPAAQSWRAVMGSSAGRTAVEEMLRLAGLSPRQVRKSMETLSVNAALMISRLTLDLAHVNAGFLASAQGEGLHPREIEALSRLNRAAHSGSGGASWRDAVRWFNARFSPQAKRWRLWPEKGASLQAAEWLDFAASRPHRDPSARAEALASGISPLTLSELDSLAP